MRSLLPCRALFVSFLSVGFAGLVGACDDCPDDAGVGGDPGTGDPGGDDVAVGMGCTSDAECASGQICCDGICKEARVPDTTSTCSYDGECGGGVCDDGGLCHAACTTDPECGTGDVCLMGSCWANPNPTPQCSTGADCGASGFTCINGTCHNGCTADSECLDPADFCDDGVCRPDWRVVSECAIDANCAAGEQCVSGQCRTRCMADADCALCPDGPVCANGYCAQ